MGCDSAFRRKPSELLRHAVVRRFPREQWDGDVIGETVWYDAADSEIRREPVHLGRVPLT